MTFRTHTLLAGLSHFLRYLSLVLLPALAAEGSQFRFVDRGSIVRPSSARTKDPSQDKVPMPYLVVVGPPPLRFREPPAPPSFELEPTATGPAFLDDIRVPEPLVPAAPLSERIESAPVAAVLPPPKTIQAATTKRTVDSSDSSPILPDDLRREIRPEDLLPYFQYPKSGGNGSSVPAPPQPQTPTLPPSSATYRLQ